MNQETWNEAMETIGVPKQKWDGTRKRFMKVLLDEHETILSSYQSSAEVWRRRGVDREGDAGVSRMLGRNGKGKREKD
jgi:hypothetical protein